MNKNGPVLIIEDNIDDQIFLREIFKKLNYPNEVLFFIDGEEALSFLNNPSIIPFLILSDINLPKLTGLELREKLRTDADLSIRCIPYLFFTKAADKHNIVEAYSKSAQGFFTKQTEISKLEKMISVIMQYWRICDTPYSVE